jgi:glycerol-3-phosphate dehydrogenase
MNAGPSTPWQPGGRQLLPALFAREWDVLVIGGGISGAGVLLEAARRGLSALLVERRDFAWGTSSRSSKLVHGGLRYLKGGHVHLTAESVREREMLLRCAPGLVEPQGFAFPSYAEDGKGRRRSLLAALAVYDLLARRRERHWVDGEAFLMLAPNVRRGGLVGGVVYSDARTDDARLVLRVLQEACDAGAAAVNYAGAHALLRENGRVTGAVVACAPDGARHEVRARVVVDATGAWSGALHGNGPRLRPLRGSHLLLPAWRLPLAQAVTLAHPRDGRPVFAYPWEGATLVGTTDLDHAPDNELPHGEARITQGEVDYLLEALRAQFPGAGLGQADILSTYAGVRPVVAGKAGTAPSKEGREHAVWSEPGLVAIAGGKLTTFRAIALDALRLVRAQLPGWNDPLDACAAFVPVPPPEAPHLARSVLRRLHGRYGAAAPALIEAAREGELERIPGTETPWAELRWAARMESVQRLDDLLLRRTRIGLLLPGGGAQALARVRAICQPELGWDDARWQREEEAYLALWRAHYSLPGHAHGDA